MTTMRGLSVVILAAVSTVGTATGQGLTLPRDGDNQRASVSQWIGPVTVTITYSSPDVTAPNGTDRRGQIWGKLVPYGMADLGWGSCGGECPWRAGANENTVFSISHDVLVEGRRLPAGSYGLHMVPGLEEWVVIFSRRTDAWGSFFYDPAQDALRITTTPRPHAYTHWLTYEFIDRRPDRATIALRWEDLEVPWSIAVENMTDIYLSRLREELTGELGFSHLNWAAAARFCVDRGVNLEEGLRWAEVAVAEPWIGQADFTSLQVLARLQEVNGLNDEADLTLERAIRHPTATSGQVHTLGRHLLAQGEKEKALRVFTVNYEKHEGKGPTAFGMARALSALGRFAEALKYAQESVANATGPADREQSLAAIELLKQGKDIN